MEGQLPQLQKMQKKISAIPWRLLPLKFQHLS